MTQPADIFELFKRMRYDLTALQAKLTDAQNMLASLNLPAQHEVKCPVCGLRFRGVLSLDEHVHLSHDGPLPPHWLEAERLAGLTTADLAEGESATEETVNPSLLRGST